MLGLIGDKEAICTRGQRAKGETVGLLLCGFGRVSRVDSCANAVLVRLSGLELLVFPTSMWEDSKLLLGHWTLENESNYHHQGATTHATELVSTTGNHSSRCPRPLSWYRVRRQGSERHVTAPFGPVTPGWRGPGERTDKPAQHSSAGGLRKTKQTKARSGALKAQGRPLFVRSSRLCAWIVTNRGSMRTSPEL